MKGEDNLGFLITASDTKEKRIRPKFISERTVSGLYQTMLITYFEENNKSQCENGSYLVLNQQCIFYIFLFIITLDQHNIQFDNRKTSNNECSVSAKTINFRNLGWENVVIYPKQIIINECNGNCSILSRTSFNLHGYLYYSARRGNDTNNSCCVPTSFDSFPIMFNNRFGNIVIKLYNDIIVRTCGCR